MEVDIELDLDALVSIDEPVPCAHSAHNTDSGAHRGNAAWMITLKCPNCGDYCRYPVCNRFVSLGLTGKLIVSCSKDCGGYYPFVDWLQDLKKL